MGDIAFTVDPLRAASAWPWQCNLATGLLRIIRKDGAGERGHFTQLARTTGDSISLALANLRLRENLQAMSTRDALTGLYNRRYLEEALDRELGRTQRHGGGGVVAMIDIDHFKQYNDTLGHDAGDAVLVALSEQLRGFRETDVACRFGGEEFILVLAEVSLEEAVERIERLRLAVAAMSIVHRGDRLPGITISVGIADFPRGDEGVASVIKHADEALYRAKAAGRDRIEVATS